MFGFKFWAFVVGAAPLDPELEAFWGRLGFVVVQGYGLTETAPIVTLNHPLRAAKGAVGKPIAGVEVKIAEDGEILVRGENVTRGYFNAPEETRSAFADGWFHTGDIGELDAGGQLRIRGRKKEMIVTSEGLNVFPEDVERVLNGIPGVRDSAVVGATAAGSSSERVQAILVIDPGTDVDAVVRTANLALLDHQKIRAATVWTAGELPRTEGTRKLKRRELRQWLEKSAGVPQASRDTTRSVPSVVSRFAPGRTVTPATTIDELGLSSLERVELMLALEETFQVTVDEGSFAAARTVGDLETLVAVDRKPHVIRRREPRTSGRGNRFSFMESLRPGLAATQGEPADVDPADRARLHVSGRPRTRASARHPRTGRVRRESSKPLRRAGNFPGPPAAVAIQPRSRDGEGVLQGALLPRTVRTQVVHPQQPELLPVIALLQCVPASAA